MKRIHMKYVIVTGILLCLSAIYYYVAARMLLESEGITIPASIPKEQVSNALPVTVTATSTWEEMMVSVSGGCGTSSASHSYGITTAGVALQTYVEGVSPMVSFRFVQCEETPVSFGVEGNQIYQMATGTQAQHPIALYWQLSEDQTPEVFIADLLATLPTVQERSWCTIKAKQTSTQDPWQQLFAPNETIYQVVVDEGYYETLSNSTTSVATALCVPYGDQLGVSFFKQVGEYLFLIPIGQNMPTFSPASFEVR